MRLLVSACLLGCKCRYDGQSKENRQILSLLEQHELIPVCPEQLGGLATPRIPSEIMDGKVMQKSGVNVTEEYHRGAQEALRLYKLLQCDGAVLKARSPSCGKGQVYDGTFSGTLREGNGITADLFIKNGIPVWHEDETEKIG